VKRRRFLGMLVTLPVIGATAGRAFGAAPVARAAVVAASDEPMAAALWGYMDHASTWDEALADLRRYVADGNTDAEMFAAVADAIEHELASGGGELDGTLGYFPGAVLMLHGLRSVRVYGDRSLSDAQAAFLDRVMERV
jgi:hypothetical protein